MAHPRIVAERQANAYQRLLAAADKLGLTYEVQPQASALRGVSSRDPHMLQMLQSEALADLLEAITLRDVQPVETGNGPTATTLRLAILNASDEELIAMPGIGDKSIDALRSWAAETTQPQAEPDAPPITVETVVEKPGETTETVEVIAADDALPAGLVTTAPDGATVIDVDAIPADVDHVDLPDGGSLDRVTEDASSKGNRRK